MKLKIFFTVLIITMSSFLFYQIIKEANDFSREKKSMIIPEPLTNYKSQLNCNATDNSETEIHFLFNKYVNVKNIKSSIEYKDKNEPRHIVEVQQ